MNGGCDKGFCLSYYKLSYRRKFIRTIWTLVIGSLAVAALLKFRPVLWTKPTWLVICGVVLVLIFLIQAAYNYSRWQAELRDSQGP